MKVEIYTKPTCPHCVNAKNAFKAANIPFTEYTIGANITKEQVQARVNALGLNVTVSTVPQIFIDDAYVGGYSDLIRIYPWANAYNSSIQRSK
jgi:glutaredoxin 3